MCVRPCACQRVCLIRPHIYLSAYGSANIAPWVEYVYTGYGAPTIQYAIRTYVLHIKCIYNVYCSVNKISLV